MKWYVILTFSLALYGETTLPDLIASAHKNDNIEALRHNTHAANLSYQTSERTYLPRIDGFANAAYVDHTAGFDARETYTAGLRGELTLFDGFKRANRLKEKNALKIASEYTLEEEKKQLSLRIIALYLEAENLHEQIQTAQTMKQRLHEQTERLEKFYKAGLASEDLLFRIKAEESQIDYTLENLSFSLKQTVSGLQLLSTKPIERLEPSHISEPIIEPYKQRDGIKSIAAQRDASIFSAEQATASHLPSLTLSDTYTYYDYRQDSAPFPRVDHQNTLQFSLQINLLDFSIASLQKETQMAQAQSKNSELSFATKAQEESYRLAIDSIQRSKTLIKNAELYQKAAHKTYQAIERKFEAGIVDHLIFLDALHTLRDAEDRLNRAQRTLSYDYATYYYHAGLDPKDYLQ